jgi:hypothetical protein
MTIFFGHHNVLSPYPKAKLANIMEIEGYLEHIQPALSPLTSPTQPK